MPGEHPQVPAGLAGDSRESIWIGYVPVEDVARDRSLLTRWTRNRFLAGPEFPFEALKVGGGPAPYRVPEGCCCCTTGSPGRIDNAFAQQKHVNYAAGAMLLDADGSRARVLARTAEPLLAPETEEERSGIVPNVVFPTAIEAHRRSTLFVFYGMADSKIGVARLDRTEGGAG